MERLNPNPIRMNVPEFLQPGEDDDCIEYACNRTVVRQEGSFLLLSDNLKSTYCTSVCTYVDFRLSDRRKWKGKEDL